MTGTRTPLGIDVGGTNLRTVVFDGHRVRSLGRQPSPRSLDELVAAVHAAVSSAARAGVAPDAIGIGLPGTVSGTVVEWVPNLSFLDGVDLGAAIEVDDLPVTLGNDAQFALLGEAWTGAARDVRSALLVAVGTGIGGAVLVDGRVVRGSHGAASSFGWAVLDTSDPGDRDLGHLERVASGTAISRRAAAMLPPRSGEQLVSDAREGDPEAVAVVASIGELLGAAIAGAASFLDPELVLIGGGVSAAYDVLGPGLHTALARWGSPWGRRVPVRPTQLGDEAGAVGAVRAAVLGQEAWV